MSIASIGLIDNLNFNNISLGTNGNITSQGTIGNLNISNDQVQPGVPYCTYTVGCTSGTDPNSPNTLLISGASNSPVSPTVDVLGVTLTGGGSVGNGTVVSIAGDANVTGNLFLSNVNSKVLATDAQGMIVPGTTANYQGKTNGAIVSLDGFFNGTITDDSWMVQDTINNINTIYFNVNGKCSAITGSGNGIVSLNMIGGGGVNIPEMNPDYVNGNPNGNVITFFGYLNNGSTPANSPAGLCYAVQGSTAIDIYFAPNINLPADDDIQFLGTFSYPISSLP